MSALASVIVLNFNGASHLDDCLQSLTAQTHSPLEVIVADNGSTDRSAQIAERYPVRWLPLGANHGFARGNNLAVEHTRGAIVLFVNNDMRFARDFVSGLVEPLLSERSLFATDARQRNWGDSEDIHLATGLARRPWSSAVRETGILPTLTIRQLQVAHPVEVLQACAGNMAIRRSMFEALGGFDSRLPAGWEDTEICWRAWLHGWGSLFVPKAVCWHKVGASSQEGPGAWLRYRGSLGGRLLFATKHLPVMDALAVWGASTAALVREACQLRWAAVARRARVMAEFTRYVPSALRERSDLYREAGRSPREHRDWLIRRTGHLEEALS
jgi:GT2 family glycosyltransferase